MHISLPTAGKANADTAVMFAVDDGYSRYAFFAARQIAMLNPDRTFDIVVVSTDRIEIPSGLRHFGIRLCHLETSGLFGTLPLDARRTSAVYTRLALAAAFSGDYRRILYLDADENVQGGDFKALLDLDLGPCAIAAVRDNIQWRTPSRMPAAFRQRGLGHAPFLNSGVLLIDVPTFNGQEILAQCMEVGAAGGTKLAGHDQDMLNVALHGDWVELSPVWNWQYTWASMLFEAMETANVVHFIGPRKPWTRSDGRLPLRFRSEYARFFAAHYPEVASLEAVCVPPHRNRRNLRRTLIKHLISTGKFCAYLDRFDSELSTHLPSAAVGGSTARRYPCSRVLSGQQR